jgi:hypothetical protein
VNARPRHHAAAWLALVFALTLSRAGPIVGSVDPFGLPDATDILSQTANQADVASSTGVKEGAHRAAEQGRSSVPTGGILGAAAALTAALVVALTLISADHVALLRAVRCATRGPPRLA